MKIEIFPSASGDCLLLTSNDGKRLLADAGLPKAYDEHIAAPLSKLRDESKPLDVVYVSHIDRDHIGGVLRLLEDEVKWRAFAHMSTLNPRLRPPKVPRPPEIGEIWHNAFLEDIERTQAVNLGTALAASANALAGLNAAALGDPRSLALAAEVEMLALSVGDAIEVNWRIGPEQLNIPLNPAFGGKLMTARPNAPITLGSLTIRVLGPTAKQLKVLREEWVAWLGERASRIEQLRRKHARDVENLSSSASPTELAELTRQLTLAVETDLTPPNLASLVLLVEEDDRRLLLTGDAGDESLLEYIEDAGLFDRNGRLEVDVLKVPHHGADNAYSDDFAKKVRAQHLIFCGDGEHHNPEPDVVRGYLKTIKAAPLSGGRPTTFWFNWSHARAVDHRELWEEVEDLFTAPNVGPEIQRMSLGVVDDRLVLDI